MAVLGNQVVSMAVVLWAEAVVDSKSRSWPSVIKHAAVGVTPAARQSATQVATCHHHPHTRLAATCNSELVRYRVFCVFRADLDSRPIHVHCITSLRCLVNSRELGLRLHIKSSTYRKCSLTQDNNRSQKKTMMHLTPTSSLNSRTKQQASTSPGKWHK